MPAPIGCGDVDAETVSEISYADLTVLFGGIPRSAS